MLNTNAFLVICVVCIFFTLIVVKYMIINNYGIIHSIANAFETIRGIFSPDPLYNPLRDNVLKEEIYKKFEIVKGEKYRKNIEELEKIGEYRFIYNSMYDREIFSVYVTFDNETEKEILISTLCDSLKKRLEFEEIETPVLPKVVLENISIFNLRIDFEYGRTRYQRDWLKKYANQIKTEEYDRITEEISTTITDPELMKEVKRAKQFFENRF